MIDINNQMDVDSLEAGLPFTSGDIEAAMRSQWITVGAGGVVPLHTGHTNATLKQSPSL